MKEITLPPKAFFANYIVRIYRFEKKKSRGLVGIVEELGAKGKKAFTNYDELWDILSSSKGIKRHQVTKGNWRRGIGEREVDKIQKRRER